LQFLYCEKSGDEVITLKGEVFNYLFKVRRHKLGEIISLRNPTSPKNLYKYRVDELQRSKAVLNLESFSEDFKAGTDLVIGWCVIEPKVFEKTLPMLNELGVKKLYLIYCDYSQKNFKIDMKRVKRVLETSSMQSGRFDILEIELLSSIDEFQTKEPDFTAIDFSDTSLEKEDFGTLLIGGEGGFSERERELFKKVKGIPSSYILRSQTATIFAISRIL